MGLRDLFNPKRTPPPLDRPSPTPGVSQQERERMGAWLEAVESGALCVPDNVHDAEAWDRYWRKQLEVGAFEQGFNDMMASDRQLVARLIGRGARAILCAGNGLSAEAFALALHGFDVTALDISSIAAAAQHATLVDGPQRLAGLTVHEDGTIVFPPDPVDAQFVPPIHRAENSHPRGGGSLRHAVGDLCDPTVCPGPFDVVIERRTVQLFPGAEQAAALARLTDRLAPRGYFITHQHKGAWRPHEPRTHFAEDWLASTNFAREGVEFPDAPRVAKLWFTTG